MTTFALFFRGLLIGLSIAAPVGPIGVLCIRRTLTEGRAAGLLSGLGAATADGLYGVVAALGLTLISNILAAQQLWLRVIGGLFLCYLGIQALRAKPQAELPPAPDKKGLFAAYATTFLLTLTNPLTIFAFAAIYAGIATVGQDAGQALLLVLGVFSGSALWWTLLSSGVSLFRARVTPTTLVWVNRVSGLVILSFGAAVLLSLWG